MSAKIPSKHGWRLGQTAVACALVIAGPAPAQADFDKTVENALKGDWGQITFDLNYRYEYANTEKTAKESANASTLRLRLGYLTPKFRGFQGFAEYEGNQDIFVNDFSSSRNGRLRKTKFDVVQDPQDNEVNQLWVSFDGIPDTLAKVGRQRIVLDNQRFIGNVAFRQMEQTYDAVRIDNLSLPHTMVTVGYLNQVRTIISTTDDIDAPFVNIGYDGLGFGKLTGYAYLLDFNTGARFRESNQTYGIRFNGSTPIGDRVTAHYTAEYAWQKDYEKNPNSLELTYLNLMAGATLFGVTGKVNMEQLDGQDGIGFATPLALKHAFQGWADIFLDTPADGIRDIYGELSTTLLGVHLAAIYHDFDDDTSSINYGKEIDLLAMKRFGKHYSVSLIYARYDADEFAVDTEKFWVQGHINF